MLRPGDHMVEALPRGLVRQFVTVIFQTVERGRDRIGQTASPPVEHLNSDRWTVLLQELSRIYPCAVAWRVLNRSTSVRMICL